MTTDEEPPEPIGYKIKTVAKMLDVSRWEVYNHISAGRLQAVRYHEKGTLHVTAESLRRFKASLIPIKQGRE